MPTHLLCVGDIHLGRKPSRIPADLADSGVPSGALSPAAAWRRVVQVAQERGVDAVVLAGDVVESDNRFFEAYGPLHAGVQQLLSAGIPVIGVAGNHDVEVLPRLAAELEGFVLLGAGGRWETHVVQGRDGSAVRLLGWSFPARRVTTSPLDTVPRGDTGDLPLIGLLHCDLDGRGGPYAPVSSAALQAAPGDAWLLGHIHQPSIRPGARPCGYLGSLTGLDPSEVGQRGAWLLTAGGPGQVLLERLPVAPLRWERVDVDLANVTFGDDLEPAIVAAVRGAHVRLASELGDTRAIGCRVHLVGACPAHRAVVQALAVRDPRTLRIPLDDRVYFVESVEDDARQALDLAALAAGSDPPGLLARLLLALERGGPDADRLVDAAVVELERTVAQPNWAALDSVEDLRTTARRDLERAGRAALDDLLAQRDTR